MLLPLVEVHLGEVDHAQVADGYQGVALKVEAVCGPQVDDTEPHKVVDGSVHLKTLDVHVGVVKEALGQTHSQTHSPAEEVASRQDRQGEVQGHRDEGTCVVGEGHTLVEERNEEGPCPSVASLRRVVVACHKEALAGLEGSREPGAGTVAELRKGEDHRREGVVEACRVSSVAIGELEQPWVGSRHASFLEGCLGTRRFPSWDPLGHLWNPESYVRSLYAPGDCAP